MPYQPINPYPYNTGLDIENGLTLYFKVDNYDIINSFKVEIHDVYKEELLYSIIRSVGEIADNKVIEGDKQIIEIYDKQNEQVYIDYYGKKSSLPVIGGQGVQSICELELTDYLMKIEDIEKTKYYNNTENAVNLQIAPAEMFTYDETGTEITGINTDYEGYEKYMADLVIPYKNTTKVGNPLIVSIGERAFFTDTTIQTLTIPNSVIEIKKEAFCSIPTLQYINFNYGTNIIGEAAFADCNSFHRLFLVDSIEQLGAYAFSNCIGLFEVIFSSRLKIISESCFYNTQIENIVIPDTVEIIEDKAFGHGYGGVSDTLQLGKNVKSIGVEAFLYRNFSEVIIPENVEKIKTSAFSKNTSLKKFICKGKNLSLGQNILGGCFHLEELIIPDIKEHDFLGYLFSDEVLTAINNEDVPVALKSVTLTNADEIHAQMFSDCPNIINYSLNEGIVSIGSNAFYNDINIQKITIPSTVKVIGSGAFAVEQNKTSDITMELNFANSKENLVIKDKSFLNNITIKTIQIPNRTVTIGLGAFEGCSKLTTIVLPFVGKEKMEATNGEPVLTGKEGYYFDYIFGKERTTQETKCDMIPSSLKTVVITDNCKVIPPYAFYGCSNIATINISSYATIIYKYAFYQCTGLSNFTIPVKCTYIGENALQYKLNSSTSYIWYSDMPYNIDNVESPVFTLQLIDNWVDLNTASFLGNMFLDITTSPYKQYILQTGNKPKDETGRIEKSENETEIVAYYTELYMYLINKEKADKIKQVGGLCGDNITYSFSEGTLTLKGQGKMFDYDNQNNISPFATMQNIKEIDMSNSLITYIGNYSFANLLETTEYTTVKFSLSLQQIGDYAFYNRRLLPTINTENTETEYHLDFSSLKNLTTIGISAFEKSFRFLNKTKVMFSNVLSVMKGNSINDSYNMISLSIPIVYTEENAYVDFAKEMRVKPASAWYTIYVMYSDGLSDSIGVTHSGVGEGCSLHIIEGGQQRMKSNYLHGFFKSFASYAFKELIIDENVDFTLIGENLKINCLKCYCGGDYYVPKRYFFVPSRVETTKVVTNNIVFEILAGYTQVNTCVIKGKRKDVDIQYFYLPTLNENNNSYYNTVSFEDKFSEEAEKIFTEVQQYNEKEEIKKNNYFRLSVSATTVNFYISYQNSYFPKTSAFCWGARSIKTLDMSNLNLTILPFWFICDCYINTIILPNTITKIYDYALYKQQSAYTSQNVCVYRKDQLPDSPFVSKKGNGFAKIKGLEYSKLEIIGAANFWEASKENFTEDFTFGSQLTKIGEYAFYKCTSFNFNWEEQHDVDKTLIIADGAFFYCSGLPSTIPNYIKMIGATALAGWFSQYEQVSLPFVGSALSTEISDKLTTYVEPTLRDTIAPIYAPVALQGKFEWVNGFNTTITYSNAIGRTYSFTSTYCEICGNGSRQYMYNFNIGQKLTTINITKDTDLPKDSFQNTRNTREGDTQNLTIKMLNGSKSDVTTLLAHIGASSDRDLIEIEIETPSGQSTKKSNKATNNKISVLSEEEDITPIEEVRAMANETATTADKKILKIENDRKYDWKLYLYGKKFDVYVTDNNTYADKSSYIPKVYLPKNSQMKEGQEIIFEGEDKYLISDIQNFNYTNKIFYRQSRGVLEGQLSYYSLLTGILTYDETNPANPWIIDADLKPYLLSNPVNFSTGSTYDKDLDKGTISIDSEDIINVNLNDKTSTEEYTKGVRITLQKTILTQAYLPTDLIDMATVGTSFTIGTDNSLQTITKIDDYYTVTVSPGFEVITNGYTSSRIVIANKNLILPQDLNTNQVVIVVDVSGKLSLEGDLYEVVKQGTIDKKLCSLIKVGVTTFELPNITSVGTTTYTITKVDSTTGKINFEDSSGNGYSIKRSDNQNYDIVLFNYLDISDEDFDTTDLHVTLNYINIYDVNKISLYASGDTEEGKLLNLKENEILYLIECSSVVNATDYQVNERSMEKEAVLERYCSIITVTNLDGSVPNSVRIPGDTWYFIYSNYIETPGYYFETVTEQPVKITINDEVIEKSKEGTYSYTLTSGIGNFLAEYEGNVSSYSWTLFEDYGGEYIEIANKQDTYSAYLFYDYFLFEDNKRYKMVLQIVTNEGLIVSYTIIINTAFNNEITLSNIYVLRDCEDKTKLNRVKEEDCVRYLINQGIAEVDSNNQIVAKEGQYFTSEQQQNVDSINKVEGLVEKLIKNNWRSTVDFEKAIKIDLDKKVINIDSSSSIKEAKVKSYYIIRRLANNHGVEDTVLAYVEDVAEFYDYSFKREDTYEYYVLPIYLVGDKEYRGVPALCQTIDKTNKIRYDLRLIVLKNTVMDYEELFKTSKIENSFEAETGEYDTWILKYNSEANNADIITDKATYDSISQFATVNKTKRNYKTGNITALLGKMHTDNEQFTYKDSILLQNKLQAFANNGKIKMLRDEIGNVMPVDITLKSFEYNPKAIPSTITVSFEWTQLADEKTFSVYKTIGVKEG